MTSQFKRNRLFESNQERLHDNLEGEQEML